MTTRFHTKTILVGDQKLGGGNPVLVQTMLNGRPNDIAGNVAQAVAVEKAGCEILRVAIPSQEAIALIPAIKEAIKIPLVADIHFDYRLALEAAAAGVDKIRINPGNIGSEDRVLQVVNACKSRGIPIRIGVNAGSVEKEILKKYGSPVAEALVESVLYHVRLLERFDFDQIVLSVKSSNVKTMVKAYRQLAEQTEYPLHLGVTEAGTERMGIIKSSAGIGSLLLDDLGDTVRVTLTEDCLKEVEAGHDILRGLGIRKGLTIISCPTCGRTSIDLIGLTKAVEKRLENCTKPITVAVMGCAVNGPGEAREADVGIAAGGGKALLFRKGEIVGKFEESEILDRLLDEVAKL